MDFAIPLTFRKVPVGAVFLGFSQKSIEQALDKARNQTIGISVVMVLIGIGGALGLAGRIARPILRLVEGTRAIAQGDFGVTLAVPSRDEIGDLTEAFNLMANNLREKEMIKRAFARYVDREVVDELLKDPEHLVLSGERRAVTVLFCDLRSFTALSERLTPEEVVMLLNDFYNLMIEATFQNAGTLDKFLGDAVMSIFGAPIAHPDHAMRAVRTAVAMRDGIEGLSARRIRDGKDPLTVGIGVSTGDAVAGTVGTEDRMEYTVIGDSVNLAARLESNAKSMQILADRFLGDPGRAWMIEDYNGLSRVAPGQEVVIPKKPWSPSGVYANGYQLVPVLVYHNIGPQAKGRLVMAARTFKQQMRYLKAHGYRVISLDELVDYTELNRQLPRRSVVLTFDDGYKSFLQYAYPILKELGFTATLFVYTDYVGNGRNALNWDDLKSLAKQGFPIGAHSKTHNDQRRHSGESDEELARRMQVELAEPLALFERRLGQAPQVIAYPYGAHDDALVKKVREHGYIAAFSVRREGNASFVPPLRIHRSQIYSEMTIEEFAKSLDVFQKEAFQ